MNINFDIQQMYPVKDGRFDFDADNVIDKGQMLNTLQDALEKRQQYKQQLQLVNWLMQQAN